MLFELEQIFARNKWSFVFLQIQFDQICADLTACRSNSQSWTFETKAQLSNWRFPTNKNALNVFIITFFSQKGMKLCDRLEKIRLDLTGFDIFYVKFGQIWVFYVGAQLENWRFQTKKEGHNVVNIKFGMFEINFALKISGKWSFTCQLDFLFLSNERLFRKSCFWTCKRHFLRLKQFFIANFDGKMIKI